MCQVAKIVLSHKIGLFSAATSQNELTKWTGNLKKKTILKKIKLQAMQDAPPLQLYPASDKFLMWNQRKAAKYL